MPYFKEIEIPERLNNVIEFMAPVENSREQLATLGQNWDLLTILGQMSGSQTDMTGIRNGFKKLTTDLVVNLANENLNQSIQDISAKSQVAVDIVIRNLFERTADIGFLSTDQKVREYLSMANSAGEQPSPAQHEAMITRFTEYVAKYSVYHNIILMDPHGKVLVQLDQNNPIDTSHDPLIQESMQTKEEFCETYRYSDLQPSHKKSLIYSYRVCETNSPGSKVLGVLCLCFKFEDEMEGVFNNLIQGDERAVILLLDDTGEVIASSDKYHIPAGAKVKKALDQEYALTDFAGRTYISKTSRTKGYQGFEGLGWYGHVMLPLERAFSRNQSNDVMEGISAETLSDIMDDPRIFSKALREIPHNANHIQADLERTVWNGNISQNAKNRASQSIKILLGEISKTGTQTKAVFERSIGELHQTVISSILNDVKFLSFLAVDIMDRNLYERANDCRWWALSPVFRSIMGKTTISPNDQSALTDTLKYINDLYTVYTNLFVYDTRGKILAVSNAAENDLVGQTLDEKWVKDTLLLRDTQHYAVSPFESTPLYENRHTYIYNACIRSDNDSGRVVGGIGIVFDSEPEFAEILNDTLPKSDNKQSKDGCFGLFVDSNRRIVSSTSDAFTVGDTFDIDDSLLQVSTGKTLTKIIELNKQHYAVGTTCSFGYREFKSEQDIYSNVVYALVFILVGEKRDNSHSQLIKHKTSLPKTNTEDANSDIHEFGTFYVGNTWLDIHSNNIVEAIAHTSIAPGSSHQQVLTGTTQYRGSLIPVLHLNKILNQGASLVESNTQQIVVVKTQKGLMGLLVDALGEIPEICATKLNDMSKLIPSQSQFIDSIVKPDLKASSEQMLIIIDPSKLLKQVLSSDSGNINDVFDELSKQTMHEA